MNLATPQIAKQAWEATGRPSCRRLEAKLRASGFDGPGYKTLAKWIKDWPSAKPVGETSINPKRAKQNLDDATPVLTGDPTTTAEDIVNETHEPRALPPPEFESGVHNNEARERLKSLREAITGDITDEDLLTLAARQALKTAIVIQGVLAEVAPALIPVAPEAVGKLQLAVAQSLEAAGVPFDKLAAARERAIKTITQTDGSEVIPPESEDPLADSIAAYKKRHAA